MKIYKKGNRRLFENDPETAATVSRMLSELERNGMDAVRKFSQQFDDWNPASFRLSQTEIDGAIAQLSEQAKSDTDFAQQNVREFATQQLKTLLPLEVWQASGASRPAPRP
jgi:sulfopropanediol 3-dehydrogenase